MLDLSEPQRKSLKLPHPGFPGTARALVGVPSGDRAGSSPIVSSPCSALETRVLALETQQQAELTSLRGEKERLRRLLGRQSGALAGLERSLRAASSNSSLLQRQQRQLLESVQRLVRVVAQGPGERGSGLRPFREAAGEREGGCFYPALAALWIVETPGGDHVLMLPRCEV